ncbi:hypothetical protein EV421DRAFT_1740932 [Armillaria borealis]|uniref:C2H2-type domain-containing protein n=1 Tax=Armillaria borealis TaxID=47425 RepID=A0AA39J3B0_9AGAR|nr:hypothetical protein EV421DRAFT_1740932 [Armillaria borealis]
MPFRWPQHDLILFLLALVVYLVPMQIPAGCTKTFGVHSNVKWHLRTHGTFLIPPANQTGQHTVVLLLPGNAWEAINLATQDPGMQGIPEDIRGGREEVSLVIGQEGCRVEH